jgi:phospholipid/cholesterol/gamma-HCH transport system substrate-binding protein
MPQERNKRIRLGIFVVVGLTFLIIGVFSIGNQNKLFVPTFTLQTTFPDAGGLQGGDNVLFSGVKVGTVKKVNLIGEGQVVIDMLIEDYVRPFIKKDATAKLSSDGLIGNTIVVISIGSENSPVAQPGDMLSAIPSLDTEEIMETLKKNNDNLLLITTEIFGILEGINKGEGSLGMLIKDPGLYQNLNETINGLNSIRAQAESATRELGTFAKKLNSEDGLVHSLFEDKELVTSLKNSLESLEETSKQAAEMTENLKKISAKAGQSGNAIDMLSTDKDFAESLKNTMKNLEASTEKLDTNMEALRSNFLFRRYFRRLEKNKD